MINKGYYIVPLIFKLEEVPCSCSCGHNIAIVLTINNIQHMVGCKECIKPEAISVVLNRILDVINPLNFEQYKAMIEKPIEKD